MVPKIISVGKYELAVLAAPDSAAAIYVHMSAADAQLLWQALPDPRPSLVAVSGVDWDSELSPWAAPRAFRGVSDFAGGGREYLARLVGELVSAAERELDTAPKTRAIAGYSLAGLFALWSLYNCNLFDAAASISGSLWYDGFIEYVKKTPLPRQPKLVYLSLGEREKQTKNARLARVEECTLSARDELSTAGVPVTLQMNPGGHFDDEVVRTARGVAALAGALV